MVKFGINPNEELAALNSNRLHCYTWPQYAQQQQHVLCYCIEAYFHAIQYYQTLLVVIYLFAES